MTTLSVFLDRNLVEVAGPENLALHQVLSDYARQFCSKNAVERHRDFYVYLAHEQKDEFAAIWAIYDRIKWAWQRQEEESPLDPAFLSLMDSLEHFQQYQGLLHDRQRLLELSLSILAEEEEDDEAMIVGFVELGRAHQDLGELQKARDAFQLALSTSQQIGNAHAQVLSHSFLGSVFLDLSEPHQAIEHLQSALALLEGMERELASADISPHIRLAEKLMIPEICRLV